MSLNVHVITCSGPPTLPPTFTGQHWVDTTNKNIYLSVGTSVIADWILVNQNDNIIIDSVNGSSSKDLDIVPLSSLCAVKYIICLSSSAQNKWKSFELFGSKATNSTVEHTIQSILGESLSVDFDFIVSGTDAKLTVTNNEIFTVDLKIHKNLL